MTKQTQVRKLDDAIHDFSCVLQMDPGHVKAAYARAACKNLKGEFAHAIGVVPAACKSVLDVIVLRHSLIWLVFHMGLQRTMQKLSKRTRGRGQLLDGTR